MHELRRREKENKKIANVNTTFGLCLFFLLCSDVGFRLRCFLNHFITFQFLRERNRNAKKKLFSDLIVSKINDANKRVMKRRICACVLFPQLKEKKKQSEANELKAKRAPIHISLSVCFRRIAVSQSSNTNFILSFVFVFTLSSLFRLRCGRSGRHYFVFGLKFFFVRYHLMRIFVIVEHF